jgi:RNA polymerase sigma-70 factor (ECF subfamily)
MMSRYIPHQSSIPGVQAGETTAFIGQSPMSPAEAHDPAAPAGEPRWFVTTHWSVVLTARQPDSPQAAAAMEQLCRTYWPPLFAFIRRDGRTVAEAEDLTQEFFARFLEKDQLAHLRHQRGKFRSFLLTLLKHFLAEQRNRARAQKRGGGQAVLSLDQLREEGAHGLEPADHFTPDQAFDRRWAEIVLQQALNRLEQEYAQAGNAALFAHLKDFQPHAPGGLSHAELGARLGKSEAAIKSAALRLRRRHREILREEIAHTVTRPEEIDEEIRHLLTVLGRSGG